MASYYYLMSSLPMLKSDGSMPFEYSKFVDMCKGAVSEHTLSILKDLTVESDTGPLIKQWAEFYGVYKSELNYQRNLRLGRQTQPPMVREESIIRAVAEAMNNENPLEAENFLLSIQFEKLDGLIGVHSFDDWSLMGYAMKLKLLERKTVFDYASGKAEFDRIVGGLKEQISSIG